MSAFAPGGDAPVVVECDECPAEHHGGGQSFDAAYRLAKADGWKISGAYAACTNHPDGSQHG